MGFTDFFKSSINEQVDHFRVTEGAVLLDVRTEREYAEGHIPGSINLDVNNIAKAPEVIPDKKTPLFVYCQSGARSSRAVSALKKMGYEDLRNIGGISGYKGRLEWGK